MTLLNLTWSSKSLLSRGFLSMQIAGKVALVTGGVSGIGHGLVETLLAEGAKVGYVLVHAKVSCVIMSYWLFEKMHLR